MNLDICNDSMKKVTSLFLFVFLPLMSKAFVGDVVFNGIKYFIITDTPRAEVIANNYSGDIVIPSTIEYNGVVCNVTKIGDKAFQNCRGLTSITLPDSLMSIGEYAFENCQSLTTITIPNGVTYINKFAFQFCNNLTSVTIPPSVTEIEKGAFNECRGLTAVHISDLEAWFKIEFDSGAANPISLAHHLFLNGEEVRDLIIPNSVTSIGKFAFYNCSSLTSVAISNSVTSILKSAFYNCSNLTSVTISSNLTYLGDYAFSNCHSLKSVVIPNRVITISDYAFSECYALTSATIGSGIKSIGNEAFGHCNELEDVYCLAVKVPNINTTAFQDSLIDHATLHVPYTSLEAYKTTVPWNNFTNIVSINNFGSSSVTPKCDKPTVVFKNGKFTIECATPNATFSSHLTADVDEHYEGNEVVMKNTSITYILTVYASAPGYENSEPTVVSIAIDKNDVNYDGWVDVADIATLSDKMARQ